MATLIFKRSLSLILPLILLAGLLVLRVSAPAWSEAQRLRVFDTFQKIKPRAYEAAPVAIVDLDDASLAVAGQWPWPRTRLAKLVERLREAGAAVIVFDILFAEPDRTSPVHLVEEWPDSVLAETLKTQTAPLPDHDLIFAQALRTATAVTTFGVSQMPSETLPAAKAGFAFSGEAPHAYLPDFPGAVSNLMVIEEAAAGNGSFNIVPDNDSIIRRAPLILKIKQQFYPSLVLEALRVAQGASTHIIKTVGGSGETGFGAATGITSIKTGNVIIPTDAEGRLWLYDTGYKPERFISAWKVLEGNPDVPPLKDKIVLIGTSATGLKDIRATPLNPVAAGVEVHAQLLEQVLLGRYLYRPDWAPGVEWLSLAVLGLVLIFCIAFAGAMASAVIGAAFVALACGLSWYAFVAWHWLLDPVFPSLSVLLIYLVSSLVRYLQTETEKREIRGAFSRYMSPALVRKLADNPQQLKLGGEILEMSFMFTDIRGFTAISEKLTAEELTRFINLFLTPMTDIILEHQGTIDKYMGDCIMAFWNAPLEDPEHARHACAAALAMRERLAPWNAEMAERAKSKGQAFPPVEIGIGVNTGTCCVGNMGSTQRFDYSVLGDEVNLASRLEGLTKAYGVAIIIGEKTRQTVPENAALEIDLIKVKGKHQSVHIYALLGPADLGQHPDFHPLAQANAAMLKAYRSRQWDQAEAQLQACRRMPLLQAELAVYWALYQTRITQFRQADPGPAWDGITVAVSK